MALKSYKPYTPGLRQKTVLSFEELTASKPEKSLPRRGGYFFSVKASDASPIFAASPVSVLISLISRSATPGIFR